ncbi:P-loop NTPase fold protein [Ornithinimicrobium cryptoxanthini]|uniref:KAP family NTPase n=1 Tax=Ornithinimicrobium cryptoxanthini TaxID=2934161 RepID=A0ABY4YKM5_9MICO|nr:P-loop NTPase fold protein [Ornithinimicrobium cryptoxanthini]USQ76805.1 KAP family NTPase [Ornithinimicrobium cryptoxanthini]
MPTPWTDAPITARSEDELGRAGYAVHAARLIADSHSWEDSIVFGLTGPWGSGKSSWQRSVVLSVRPGTPGTGFTTVRP